MITYHVYFINTVKIKEMQQFKQNDRHSRDFYYEIIPFWGGERGTIVWFFSYVLFAC